MAQDKTIGILGCGSLGTAILKGLLSSTSTSTTNSIVKPAKILVSVTSDRSKKALISTLGEQTTSNVEIFISSENGNAKVAQGSDIIILATPPPTMKSVVGQEETKSALNSKILVSLLAGVTRNQIEAVLTNDCAVFRAMPNLAASLCASATALESSDPQHPADKVEQVDALFRLVGQIEHMPASLMDACTPLCGSTPAFIALFIDALVDGAVAGGVPRIKAQSLASQALASTAALLKEDNSPAKLRETVCAMPGCTIQGSLTLEQGGVRGVTAKTMQDAIKACAGLG